MNAEELKTQRCTIDVFQGLSKRALGRARAGRVIEHPDGHEIIAEGHGAVGLHLITAGTARVTSGGSVRRTLGVGDYFGEISVIDGKPRSASVEAITGLTTFAIHPTTVNGLPDDNPAFARKLLLLLCARLREAESRA